MTHWRQEILGAAKAALIAAETSAGERVFVERAETLAFPNAAAADEHLPAIILYLPRATRTFGETPGEGRGDGTLVVEVVATGANGEAAGAARDAVCEEVETVICLDMLLGPAALVERFATIEDEVTIGKDGAVLLTVAKMSFGFKFTSTASFEPEDEFLGADESDDIEEADELVEQTFPLDPPVEEDP